MSDDPFSYFATWLAEASEKEPDNPNAMSLATVGADGYPSSRVVLMKDGDPDGFVFYTNLASTKGQDLAHNAKAGICFHWKSLGRQVRAEGDITRVDDSEADAYFATRPRVSQIGAWASRQSEMLADRAVLENAVQDFEDKFQGRDVPRPPHWSGYRLRPRRIEFWEDRPFRLHNRDVFERQDAGWRHYLIYP